MKEKPKIVNKLILTAREGNQGFPVSYQIMISTPEDGAKFINLGTFTTQPVAGKAVVRLPASYTTHGVGIVPVQLGRDSLGGYYFQMAEIQLAYDTLVP